MKKLKKKFLKTKDMKKCIAGFVLFLMTTTTMLAQTAFDKFEDKDGVTSVIVNKKMFEMMGKMAVDAKEKDAQNYFSLLKKLDNLKVFTTDNAKVAADMKATVTSYLKNNPLEELMRVNDSGKKVNIYIKSAGNGDIVKELLMFIEDPTSKENQTVVLSLVGNFNLSEIATLTAKMNLPGGDQLNKASKK